MKLRHRVAPFMALVALFAATAAYAAKPAPEILPLTGETFNKLDLGAPRLNATCNLGVSTGATTIVNYIAPPDDAYYTLLDPATCSSCPGGSFQLFNAHALLNWRVATCQQTVRVRIVPAILSAPGCYVPDPNGTLCGPLFYNLAPGAAGNFQFNLPLPAGCCIQGPAFLEIDFVTLGTNCSTSTTVPRLITTSTCNPCVSWNVYPGGFDDLCTDIGFPGNPVMWADGDCCAVVPTVPGTWGRVKTLYR